jgi:hypothetical protein
MPTETAPTTVPSLSRSGTLPRAERPSVPLSISMTSLPAKACPGSVETMPPICLGSVCDQRTPRQSITTTYSALVTFRIRSASFCTGPFGEGGVSLTSAASPGCCAVVCAIASARRIAWSSSWLLRGARNNPVASTATPAAIATCISRTCENTRRGRPRRRRRAGGVGLIPKTVRGAGHLP